MAFRTDLAVEAIENHKTTAALPHVRQSDRTLEGFAVHEVRILSEDAAREIGKPQGRYLTLELDVLIRREEDAFPRACKALSTLLRELLPHPNDGPVLIAGLGNRMITPDAIVRDRRPCHCHAGTWSPQSPAISRTGGPFPHWLRVCSDRPASKPAMSSAVCSTACALPLSSLWMRLPPVGCRGCCVRSSWQIPGITPVPAWETPVRRSTRKHSACRVIAVGVPTVDDGARSHMRSAASLSSLPAKRWTTSPAGDDHHARH